eukprot:CAMPEP_0177451842 /NCGR_PEP_ID=MMETSP0369-20130122/9991_1 /TAXON_ID=447022 ORGANISM="Scrippsiella hangoei-like, Strain SHHI-4" /NCGR_SAMPLE_ID=MMETSP0369 /ASSEMBLY_ACC=CAM_ASM_000364 /LENGTH=185 /DNA_ID=CAMNT_0018924477 /DNA_START=360 /DNA_END=918 /DNA_ORIENTATION=-
MSFAAPLTLQDLRVFDERAPRLHLPSRHHHGAAHATGALVEPHLLQLHDHVLHGVRGDIAARADADVVADVQQVVLEAVSEEAHPLADFRAHETHEDYSQPSACDGLHQVAQRGECDHERSPTEVKPRVVRSVACSPLADEHPLQSTDYHQHQKENHQVNRPDEQDRDHLAPVAVSERIIDLEIY